MHRTLLSACLSLACFYACASKEEAPAFAPRRSGSNGDASVPSGSDDDPGSAGSTGGATNGPSGSTNPTDEKSPPTDTELDDDEPPETTPLDPREVYGLGQYWYTPKLDAPGVGLMIMPRWDPLELGQAGFKNNEGLNADDISVRPSDGALIHRRVVVGELTLFAFVADAWRRGAEGEYAYPRRPERNDGEVRDVCGQSVSEYQIAPDTSAFLFGCGAPKIDTCRVTKGPAPCKFYWSDVTPIELGDELYVEHIGYGGRLLLGPGYSIMGQSGMVVQTGLAEEKGITPNDGLAEAQGVAAVRSHPNGFWVLAYDTGTKRLIRWNLSYTGDVENEGEYPAGSGTFGPFKTRPCQLDGMGRAVCLFGGNVYRFDLDAKKPETLFDKSKIDPDTEGGLLYPTLLVSGP